MKGNRNLAAKIYHDRAEVNTEKLGVMLANSPRDPMNAKGHVSIAWPLDLLQKGRKSVAGFLMPRVEGSSLFSFMRPKVRRKEHPGFTYHGLLRISRNAASAFSAVHAERHVVGDVNPQNVLATERGLVSLIDTDSFQIKDPQGGRLFSCKVGVPHFTPPEHQGKKYADFDCDETHDRFGLAVLIFLLLMEGNHPFAGPYQGKGTAPNLEGRIASGHWPYAREESLYAPRPASPPLSHLHPTLRRLFRKAFVDGFVKPQDRPSARRWKKVIGKIEEDLVRCQANPQHFYSNHLRNCPWCRRKHRLNRDPYPRSSSDAQKRGRARRQPTGLSTSLFGTSPQSSKGSSAKSRSTPQQKSSPPKGASRSRSQTRKASYKTKKVTKLSVIAVAIALMLVVYMVSQAGSSSSEAGQASTNEEVSGETGKLKAGPKANPDRFQIQSRPVIFDVLSNDRGTDGDELRIKAIEKSSTFLGFTTSITDDQRIKFMPGLRSYVGSNTEVEFWYTITDSHGATDKTKVQVQVR